MKAALLIIDMQKDFFKIEACRPSLNAALEYANGMAEFFRKNARPVFLIQDTEAGGDLFEGLKTAESDTRLSKDFSNAFWKTTLEEELKKSDSDFLVICGFSAVSCVLATYNGAIERGFTAALLQNGVASNKDTYIQTAMETCDVISYTALEYLFKG